MSGLEGGMVSGLMGVGLGWMSGLGNPDPP